MSRREVPEQHAVGLGVIIAAFNENGVQTAVDDFGGGKFPREKVAWVQRDAVGFYVAPHHDFMVGEVAAKEIDGGVYDTVTGGLGCMMGWCCRLVAVKTSGAGAPNMEMVVHAMAMRD